jgi:mRNA interferase YafQ
MKTIRRTSQFKRDVRRMQRRHKDLGKLKTVLESLVREETLAPRYRDHVLVGQYRGTRECHLEPDWLLVYESGESEIVLVRTGAHSDLFK